MKKFTFQVLALLAVIGVALYLFKTGALNSLSFIPASSPGKQIVISGNRFKIEIADTDSKRKKGLGGRESLASDEGMLFIFEASGKHPFWMKGMKLALDLIWINKDAVVDITENVGPPAAGQKDASLPIYQAKEDANKVLEVNAGTAQKLNIKAGDSVKVE
ncbi:MAG: DUF192 domain-containing protein [Candidatus Daviesbacteria bacterium]|nr:DUF192 domain-containing protein [Candidatus Daviesbacteria bacterium]